MLIGNHRLLTTTDPVNLMQRFKFTTISESTATRRLVFSQPRIPVNLTLLYNHRLRHSWTSWKDPQTSTPIRKRLQRFHLTLSRRTMSNSTSTTFYDFKADLPGGKTYDFDQLKGRVVLVVNVASQWYAQPFFSDRSCAKTSRH